MKIPELRTCKHMISPATNYREFHEAVMDEKGNVVAVFFGPYAKLLAEYVTSWTDIMKLAQAQVKAEDQTVAAVKTPERRFDFQGGKESSIEPVTP